MCGPKTLYVEYTYQSHVDRSMGGVGDAVHDDAGSGLPAQTGN
jgi:hypothetical protein